MNDEIMPIDPVRRKNKSEMIPMYAKYTIVATIELISSRVLKYRIEYMKT